MRPSQSAAALIIGTAGSRPSSGREDRPASAGRVASTKLALTSLQAELRTPRKPFNFNQLSKFTKVEFRNGADDYGLVYDGQIVVCVRNQARRLGVKPGWKIEMIDDVAVKSSADIWAKLQEAQWQWRSCHISFLTDMKAIKAEQMALRIGQIMAEEERLAKLPFTDSQDPKHIDEIKEFISFKGYIDHREDRAITLPQLKMVTRWVKAHCHRWRDADPPELSKTSRMHLTMDFMNTYHLNHWLIKPATLEKDCSFVEMLTAQKQPADWFAIHWWGDRLQDVAKCLELHIQTRELSESTAFWFGAFAGRAHSMNDNVCVNPEATCYYRAMKQAKFQVLVILDSKLEPFGGPATAFKRAWCAYELGMTLAQSDTDPVIDLATYDGSRPSMITRGLTTAEENMENLDSGSGYRAKAEREKGFSLDFLGLALNIQIQSGLTVRPLDKQKILNSVAQRDLTLEIDPKHESYNKLNQRIRATLALAFWRRVMIGAGENPEIQAVQLRTAQALRGDEWRPSLDISMAYMSGTDIEQKLQTVANNLPTHLKNLTLDLRGCDIDHVVIGALAKALPLGLETFSLDLGGNSKVDNSGIEGMVPKLPPNLQRLKLNLQGTATTKELQEKRHSLEDLKQHIIDEAEKGHWQYHTSMCPSATGRMITTTHKFKA